MMIWSFASTAVYMTQDSISCFSQYYDIHTYTVRFVYNKEILASYTYTVLIDK